MLHFFESNDYIQFLAIIPHHNTLSDLERIQQMAHHYPLYPLITPLCSLEDNSCNSTPIDTTQLRKFIKEQQKTLTHCSLCIKAPELRQKDSNIKKIICPIQGLPTFKSDYLTEKRVPEPFTKNAFTLTYETPVSEQNSHSLQESILMHKKASLTMRVYRIGIVTVKKIPNEQSNKDLRLENILGFSWTVSHDVWVKSK
ncbi:MAG: hypothetical protein BKP49_08095 [Treponema sp. CETP13]|nr:MAG: hypothetical protein BKP49_08095 [Treponema sp. CETP13]